MKLALRLLVAAVIALCLALYIRSRLPKPVPPPPPCLVGVTVSLDSQSPSDHPVTQTVLRAFREEGAVLLASGQEADVVLKVMDISRDAKHPRVLITAYHKGEIVGSFSEFDHIPPFFDDKTEDAAHFEMRQLAKKIREGPPH
jgi:hypothetical protein